MIENKTTSDCTIYAFVGTAILAISLVVAVYVGNDFHQSLCREQHPALGDIHFHGELSL